MFVDCMATERTVATNVSYGMSVCDLYISVETCYLANFHIINSKFCIGVCLLSLEDLLDGDRTQGVATSALRWSESLSPKQKPSVQGALE
jgi:hypothetical protein